MVGIYASSMPAEQLERNGVDPDSLKPIIEAIGGGDLARGVELTTPEIAEKLSFAGTPEEVTAQIKEIEPAGVNHLIAAITDASLVKAFTGRELPGRRDGGRAAAAAARRGDARLRVSACAPAKSGRCSAVLSRGTAA